MSLLISTGNSNISRPGTSFNELPTVNHHQFSGSIASGTINKNNNNNSNNSGRESNLKYHDSNGEVITVLTNHTAGSSDMSSRNFQPNQNNDDDDDDDDLDTQVDIVKYILDFFFS